jgi:hypothetical protein
MVKIIVAIASSVIAFMAIFGLIDAIVSWFLRMINLKNAGLAVNLIIYNH